MSPALQQALDFLMSIADELKAALAILSDQIAADQAARLADASAATAAGDANAAALTEALALVKTLSGKLPPLPVADEAMPAPPVA